MASIFLILGGSLFGILGLLHALYMFTDISNPRHLVPDNLVIIEAMSTSSVRLARGESTMWRAWLGFNFSHSLGAVLFGCACIVLGISLDSLALPKAVLLVPVAVGAIYLWLSILYWFRIPSICIALGTLCFTVGWLMY